MLIKPSTKTLFSRRHKSSLCLALAVLVALCALMIAIPGFSNALLGVDASSHCLMNSSSEATSTAELHGGSATTICSGDLLTVDRSVFVDLLPLLSTLTLFVLVLLVVQSSAKHNSASFRCLGPPFQGQIRSHLGLRRIHI